MTAPAGARQTPELLADWLDVQRQLDVIELGVNFNPETVPAGLIERADCLNAALFALDPAALRAQAAAEAGLREAVAQLMSDPWSYHYEESGTTKRCVGCGEKEGAVHEYWCPIPSITAALAQAQAGAETSGEPQ